MWYCVWCSVCGTVYGMVYCGTVFGMLYCGTVFGRVYCGIVSGMVYCGTVSGIVVGVFFWGGGSFRTFTPALLHLRPAQRQNANAGGSFRMFTPALLHLRPPNVRTRTLSTR